jgi:uncharacterized repeat protein (TIGR01451 family)
MRTYLLVILSFLVSIAYSQHFEKLSNGMAIKTFYHQQGVDFYLTTADNNGQVYHLYYDTISSGFNLGKEFIQVRLQVYNGTTWLFSAPLKLYNSRTIEAPRVLDLLYSKGVIYVAGSFDSTENNMGTGLVCFKEGKWQTVGLNLILTRQESISVSQVLAIKEGIFINGNFDSISGYRVNGLLMLKNNSWQPLGRSVYGYGAVSDPNNTFFRSINDSLYVFNKNKIKPDSMVLGGTSIRKLGQFVNDSFVQLPTPSGLIGDLFTFDNKCWIFPASNLLYISSISVFENNNWISYSLANDSFYVTNYLGVYQYNNQLFVFFQNPSNPSIDIYLFDGSTVKKVQSWKHSDNYTNIKLSISESKAYLVGNYQTLQNTNYIERVNRIALFNPESRGIVTIKAFNDQNNDGVYQESESGIENAIIEDLNSNSIKSTNKQGNVQFSFPLNSAIKLKGNDYNGLTNPNEMLLNIGNRDTFIFLVLPYQKKNINDIEIMLFSNTANEAIQNKQTLYRIKVVNKSSNNLTINIGVQHPENIKDLNLSSIMQLINSQDSKSFIISDYFIPNQEKVFQFSGTFDNDIPLGEQVNMIVRLLNFDELKNNNNDTLKQTIVKEIKGHSKIAYPESVVNTSQVIKYHINFQNDINDTVVNVTVIDSIHSLLDIRKVVIGGATHPYKFEVKNNKLIWHLENINLPSKNIDSNRSKGSVSFNIYTNKSAKEGDTIVNQALVYYDYNPPKVTNKTNIVVKPKTAITTNESKSFAIYPNPSKGVIKIQTNSNSNKLVNMELYDRMGVRVFNNKVNLEEFFQIPESLSNGIYLIKIDGIVSQEKLVLLR